MDPSYKDGCFTSYAIANSGYIWIQNGDSGLFLDLVLQGRAGKLAGARAGMWAEWKQSVLVYMTSVTMLTLSGSPNKSFVDLETQVWEDPAVTGKFTGQ